MAKYLKAFCYVISSSMNLSHRVHIARYLIDYILIQVHSRFKTTPDIIKKTGTTFIFGKLS